MLHLSFYCDFSQKLQWQTRNNFFVLYGTQFILSNTIASHSRNCWCWSWFSEDWTPLWLSKQILCYLWLLNQPNTFYAQINLYSSTHRARWNLTSLFLTHSQQESSKQRNQVFSMTINRSCSESLADKTQRSLQTFWQMRYWKHQFWGLILNHIKAPQQRHTQSRRKSLSCTKHHLKADLWPGATQLIHLPRQLTNTVMPTI